MQPDPTPDLNELERLMRSSYVDVPGHVRLAAYDNALPWLIRAARERDELRAKVESLRRWRDDVAILVKDEGGIHFDDVAPRVKELRAEVARQDAILIDVDLKLGSLRTRAEKAEADLAESKRLVEKAEARAKELEDRVAGAERLLNSVVISGGSGAWDERAMRDWCCEYKDWRNGFSLSWLQRSHENCRHRGYESAQKESKP